MSRILCALGLAVAGLRAETGEIEVKGSAGYSQFGIESLSSHVAYGGAVRIYLVSRLSVEPELLYLRRTERGNGSGKHYLFNPNVAFDLRRSDEKVVPYVTGGPGYYRYEGTDGLTWSGGLGVKVFVSRRWFVAPEFRVGYAAEPFWRLGVGVGYSFSKRR